MFLWLPSGGKLHQPGGLTEGWPSMGGLTHAYTYIYNMCIFINKKLKEVNAKLGCMRIDGHE